MYQYWRRFGRSDGWFNKSAVSIALCADIGGIVASTSMCYLYTVTHFGEFFYCFFCAWQKARAPFETASLTNHFFRPFRRRRLRSLSTVSVSCLSARYYLYPFRSELIFLSSFSFSLLFALRLPTVFPSSSRSNQPTAGRSSCTDSAAESVE